MCLMRYLLLGVIVLGLATVSFALPTAGAMNGCKRTDDPNCPGIVCVYHTLADVCVVDTCAGRTDCCDGGLPQRPFWCPEDAPEQ